MSALVDPRICPDCRAPLSDTSVCTGCGLNLTGPKAAELWLLMQQADALITALRQGPTGPVPAPPPVAVPARRSPRLPSLSVPVVLLGLGALCVLVAAVVFVAVAWGSLGLGAKAAILLGVTGLFATGATAVTRRGLRVAAETFWVIVAALIAVDLAAAYGADVAGLGDLASRHVVAITGALVLLLAIGIGSWVPSTPTRRVAALVGVAGIGTFLITTAEAYAADRPALAVSVALAAITVLAGPLLRSPDLRPTGYAVAANAVLAWIVLLGIGFDRGASTSVSSWWHDLNGWPLLVAAGYAGAVASTTRIPDPVRMVGSTGALVALGLFALGGDAGATEAVLAAAGVAVALAAVSAAAVRIWALPAAVMTLGAVALSALFTLLRPWSAIEALPTTGPARTANLDLRVPSVGTELAAWTAVVIAGVVLIGALGLVRHLAVDQRAPAQRSAVALGTVLLGLGATTAILEREPRIVIAVLCWALVLALAGGAAVITRDHSVGLLGALGLLAYLSVLGLRLAVPSHLLAALLASGIAIGLGAAYARAAANRLEGLLLPFLVGSSLLTAGFAATHWPYLVNGGGDAAGVTLAGVSGAALLLARTLGRGEDARRTVEGVAIVLGLAATGFTNSPALDAVALTVLGAALALVAVLNRDRDLLGWASVGVLALATALRLDGRVEAPELYTIPIAALLLLGGIRRLGEDPAVSSVRALGNGLVLGLVPSLLLALDDPVTLRGTLTAVAAVLVLGTGVRLRWAAPFLAGAAVAALLTTRHLGSVADAVPRWATLAAAGAAFLLIGITWEARRRNLATAERYLASLR